jgi:hypothetical protein
MNNIIILSIVTGALLVYAIVTYIRNKKDTFSINDNIDLSFNLDEITYTKGVTFSGGGMRSFTSHHADLFAILYKKRAKLNNNRIKFNDLFKSINGVSGLSGGSWYISMVFYDKIFNNATNNIGNNLNSDIISQHFWNDYLKLTRDARIRSGTESENLLQNRDIPSYMTFLLRIFSYFSPQVLDNVLYPWIKYISEIMLLNRLKTTKMKDKLPSFNNIDITIISAITTDSFLSNNSNNPSLSYVLKPNFCSQPEFPCNPGPLIRNQNSSIKESNGNMFNTLIFNSNDPTRRIPSNNFSNTCFDTCEWKRLYTQRLLLPDIPTNNFVYRCQNVGCAECCRNNSNIQQCPVNLPLFFSSIPQISPMNYKNMSGQIQYVAYNYLTEKEPTGTYSGNITNSQINSNSKRVYYNTNVNQENIDSYDTSEELITNCSSASSAFYGNNTSCYMKNSLYAGFSDQEQLLSQLLAIWGNNHTPILSLRNNSNIRISNDICNITNCARLFNNVNPNISWNSILEKLASKCPVKTSDGGTVDGGSGIVGLIKQHQSIYGNIGNMDIVCFTSTIFDSTLSKPIDIQDDPRLSYVSSFIRSLFKNQFIDPNRPFVSDLNMKSLFKDVPDQLKNIFNSVANYNLVQESLLLAGSTISIILDSLLAVLSPILGSSVAMSLSAPLTNIIIDLIDLDTDYHVIEDRYNKKYDSYAFLALRPAIFDAKFEDVYERTNFTIKDNGKIYLNIIKYKNLNLIDNVFLGIKKGTTINNLYVIQTFYDYKYAQMPSTTNIEDYLLYKEEIKLSFEALVECLDRNPNLSNEILDYFQTN